MTRYVNTIILAACGFAGLVHADTIHGVDINFEPIGSAGYGTVGDLGYVGHTYRIGKNEVSVTQFLISGIVLKNTAGPNRWGSEKPAVYMDWHEAAMYCNFLTSGNTNSGAYTVVGGRVTGVMSRTDILNDGGMFYLLPTEDEWCKAAYFTGSGYSLYANGTDIAPVDESDSVYGRDDADGPWTTVSGTEEQNKTLNMMGNVWEWLETPDESDSTKMVFRGGDYFQGTGFLESSQTGTSELSDGAFQNTGFRVVAIPEPGTISLMSLSTIGLFLTRRIRRRTRLGSTLAPVRREFYCDAFCSEEEWCAYMVEETHGADGLAELKHFLTSHAVSTFCYLRNAYGSVEKVFWNRMVITHDRRVIRHRNFRTSFKKKVLTGFDAFLALIMK